MENTFYVYTHHKATNGDIFYVGKGCGDRAHIFGRNEIWDRIVKKHGYYVKFFATGLTEAEAFSLEIALIAEHGRLNTGTGALANMTDGGEGNHGIVLSQEVIDKRNDAIRASHNTPEFRKSCSVRNHKRYKNPAERAKTGEASRRASTPDVKAKISSKSKERWDDPIYRSNLSKYHKLRWSVVDRNEFSEKMREVASRPGVNESRSKKVKSFFASEAGEKAKANISVATKQRWAAKREPVVELDSGIIFADAYEALNWQNVNGKKPLKSVGDILAVCRGKGKTAGGFRWGFHNVNS